ncbi:MAG: alpha/beta hydrolase [Candidatus Riflebacteria bacterium]|nr:alpha/beta hydrolase [Candidatus Riflebacteria bacterium]
MNYPDVVVFPGWATDYRIFENLHLEANLIFPPDPFEEGIEERLATYFVKNKIGKATILGWSLGGFISARFAKSYPGLVKNLVLCGMRPEYPHELIEETRRKLLADRDGFLKNFYRQCFLPAQKSDYNEFHKYLLSQYLAEMDNSQLSASLELLGKLKLEYENPGPFPSFLIHGFRDVVAPVQEMENFILKAQWVTLKVLINSSHAVFLNPEFSKTVNGILNE